MNVGMTIVGQLFKPRSIINPLRNAAKPGLARAGARLMGIARRLIKRRKQRSKIIEINGIPILFTFNSSAPGTPPYQHTPKDKRGLKESILFAVQENDTVIIGPAESAIGRIGHTHEFGGSEPAVQGHIIKENWKLVVGGHGPIRMVGDHPVVAHLRTVGQVERASEIGQTVKARWTQTKRDRTYPPRPFMAPALAIAQERLPQIWADAVRRAA